MFNVQKNVKNTLNRKSTLQNILMEKNDSKWSYTSLWDYISFFISYIFPPKFL